MKPFNIIALIFRFIAVCLVAYWAFVFVGSFLPLTTTPLLNRDELDPLFKIVAANARNQCFIYIVAGVILYFAAPLLALLVTWESASDSDWRKDYGSLEPPVTLRHRRTAYLVIIGLLIVMGGSIIFLLSR